MKELELSARTVEEATRRALEQLGLRLDQVEIEVLEEGKSGLLGIGAENARIRVTETANRINHEEVVAMAQDTLENILAYMGLDARVDCLCDNAVADDEEKFGVSVVFNIKGADLGILIGRRGQTLACVQYILRLMISQQTGLAMAFVLDVNGYKSRRYESLRVMAQHIAEQVEGSGRSCALEPMPAYERRIVHMVLAEHPYVVTESVGFGEARKVVVLPRK
ncbi:MAG: protein jag [Dehalococcoidia bacterium]|nr:protein jag [Dehalococcoidia bacterium]